MAATASVGRNKLIVTALCKHLSLNPNLIPVDGLESDVKSLYLNISKASGHGLNDSNEVKWVAFAETFPETPDASFEVLQGSNDELYNLFTDEKGVATFKGIPFMTSGGPCPSSIPKATIK